MTNLAAIDVGSNGARLLLANREGQVLRKRRSTGLGHTPFRYGEFRPQCFEKVFDLFEHFVPLMKEHNVSRGLCVATSAFREAANASALTDAVAQRFGIPINIISGQTEIELVLRGIQRELDPGEAPHILIDIGGGSTELALAQGPLCLANLSIDVGTLRLLDEKPSRQKSLLKTLKERVARDLLPALKTDEPVRLIGTGGNLRRLGKLKPLMLDKSKTSRLDQTHFKTIAYTLENMKTQERIRDLDLDPNRAEVIVPACHILDSCLPPSLWERMELPNGGLVDGVLDALTEPEDEALGLNKFYF